LIGFVKREFALAVVDYGGPGVAIGVVPDRW
jgi:hypothetical protein